MKEGILVINYKSYPSSYGKKALEIAKAAERIATETGTRIILAVPPTEIRSISSSVGLEVISQHVDPITEGAGTGYVTPQMVKAAGGKGSLLNHSENRMILSDIETAVDRLREIGLYSIACASSPKTAAALSILSPDMIAVEPPELIGTGISVSKARPEVIRTSIDLINKTGTKALPILVGAGVSTREDVEKAVELGASGVLVASAVMRSNEPEKIIAELAGGLTRRL